jgi:hypothetical protein
MLTLCAAAPPNLVCCTQAMRARPVAICNSFQFIIKEYPVLRFHPFARGALYRSVYPELAVPGQFYFSRAKQLFKLLCPCECGFAQINMPDHDAS